MAPGTGWWPATAASSHSTPASTAAPAASSWPNPSSAWPPPDRSLAHLLPHLLAASGLGGVSQAELGEHRRGRGVADGDLRIPLHGRVPFGPGVTRRERGIVGGVLLPVGGIQAERRNLGES